MTFLVLMLIAFVAVYKLGHGAGEVKERERHDRAVDEAQRKIASLDDWRRR